VRELLIMRFGKPFGQVASDNSDARVNERVLYSTECVCVCVLIRMAGAQQAED
jgi:hypothetical protein